MAAIALIIIASMTRRANGNLSKVLVYESLKISHESTGQNRPKWKDIAIHFGSSLTVTGFIRLEQMHKKNFLYFSKTCLCLP